MVLAGHSYGGMVITGTAAQVADRVRGMLYVDAALPDPGQSIFDIIESGGRDPLSFPGLEAAPRYELLPITAIRRGPALAHVAVLPAFHVALCVKDDLDRRLARVRRGQRLW